MNKVIRDGKVAVLYSPGYGAGWFSWNTWCKECLFSPEIVAMVEAGINWEKDWKKVEKKAKELFNKDGKEFEVYDNAVRDLKIAWIDEGAVFQIHENEGYERIKISYDDWIVA